jgi:hypothetical protein
VADAEDDFDKAFAGFGEEPKQPESPGEEPKKPEEPVTPPAAPKEGEADADKNKPGDKPEDTGKPADGATPPAAPEEPKPLTEEGVRSIIQDIQTNERTSTKQLQETTNEVLEAYYPDGLSNVLIDQSTGKELKTPQDVVDASNGEMDIEQATQWLMNEQYKLDTQVNSIKDDAQKIAEQTINFKRDSMAALQKYEPLFKWQPALQRKVWDNLKKQVNSDVDKGVILSAPDVMDFYDFYLEPYQKAFEFSQNKPATNPTPPAPEPPKPGTDDRLDEGGDGGGGSDSDDPNDFAQQTRKELAKGNV